MVNKNHFEILEKGVDAWNQWRKENPSIKPDLQGAKILEVVLNKANLREVDFGEANLFRADLKGAFLTRANLIRANLYRAILFKANLFEANLFRIESAFCACNYRSDDR